MYKIKKKPSAKDKAPVLYNIIEDYTEHDAPGNVCICAMTEQEDVHGHAKVLAESYEVPLDDMTRLLTEGGVHVYTGGGPLVTRGAFVCRIDPSGEKPKQTFVMDIVQYGEAEQLARSAGLTLADAAEQVFRRGLSAELRERLDQKNLGLDYSKLDRHVAKGGDIKYIDFRKDWSPHFKRLCIMPNGDLVETGGVEEFARLHKISVPEAAELIREGGIREIEGGEVLACQIVNGQPAVARFNSRQYDKAKALAESQGIHIMDALSEVGFSDPAMMRGLKRAEIGRK